MSLRQRGQRASESTNEGGSSGGIYSPSPSSANSNSGGYNYGASPPQVSGGNTTNNNGYGSRTGGYYNASGSGMTVNTAPGYSYVSASSGYGGAYGSNNNNAAAVSSPYANSNTTPTNNNYNAGGYGSTASSSVSSPYNHNNNAAYGNSHMSAYGGYSNNNNGAATTTTASAQNNPFHTTTKKSPLQRLTSNILPLLLGLTICTLTATTLHFRHTMLSTRHQIELSKQTISSHHRRSQERFQNDRDQSERERIDLMEGNARLQTQIDTLEHKHQELTTRHTSLMEALNGEEITKQSMLKKIDSIQFKLEDLAVEEEKYTSMMEGKEELEQFSKRREEKLWEVVERLEGRIGRESWREAEEWFGPGPHKVEIDLEYPLPNSDPPSKWPRTRNRIIIEMAPLDLMPHSVNLFLQQVHHRLWDGNEITANPAHIMSFGYKRASIHEKFVDKALETVSYQEYSNKYPHEQWTVGFMGRPGGPDFYINKRDNSVIHGPGGQANSRDMHNEADPCFGKVVEGVEILNQINEIPVDERRGGELTLPVKIVSARVMGQRRNEDAFDGGEVPLPEER